MQNSYLPYLPTIEGLIFLVCLSRYITSDLVGKNPQVSEFPPAADARISLHCYLRPQLLQLGGG